MVFQYTFAQFQILSNYQMQNLEILEEHYLCNRYRILSHYSMVLQSKYFWFHQCCIKKVFLSFLNEYHIFCRSNAKKVFPIPSLQPSIFCFCILFNCFKDCHTHLVKFEEFLSLFYQAKDRKEDFKNSIQGTQFKKIETITTRSSH